MWFLFLKCVVKTKPNVVYAAKVSTTKACKQIAPKNKIVQVMNKKRVSEDNFTRESMHFGSVKSSKKSNIIPNTI